ncbi:hypothetical protein [Undibacterium sp.]|jgi:hypothetical protein|uniref:hypothetical protein n=1 Tax=Undibacterium sp. TaxID=1914977 RepID=UPI002B8796B0|nr:hypothetical protein [Undibacterium sp.]HTD05441.1 hypothetical protein [Undibacterium sp.]
MNLTIASKALILAGFLAASCYFAGSHTAVSGAVSSPLPAQPAYPAGQPASDAVQTVIVSAKRLTPAEKARIDEIENQLSTQNALPPKKHARILT